MALGFQTAVGTVQAPAVEGDFANMNPRFTVPAGPGGLVTGPSGVRVGYAVWTIASALDPDNEPTVVNNFGTGPIAGIVARENQGLITTYLLDAGMTIPAGFGVTVYNGVDIWVKNNGTTQALIGNQAFAQLASGQFVFQAAGSSAATTSLTTSSIAAGTAITGTASIAGNILTATAVTAGTIYPGTILTGPSGVASGTQVVYQIADSAGRTPGVAGYTPGGVGSYALSIGEQTVASGALAGTYGVLTVGGGGPPVSGSVLSGSGVTTGTAVFQQLTASTWVVSPSQTASSTTITATTNVATKWYAMSSGSAGEIVKISDHQLG